MQRYEVEAIFEREKEKFFRVGNQRAEKALL